MGVVDWVGGEKKGGQRVREKERRETREVDDNEENKVKSKTRREKIF